MSDLLQDIAIALDQAVLRCDNPQAGELLLVEGQSSWLSELLPDSQYQQPFIIEDDCYFLQDFMVDAKALWLSPENGRLRSGFWTESLSSGRTLHLEAVAIKQGNTQVLLIHNQSEEFRQRQKTIQSARELTLANDKLQEQYQYLHHRLLAMINSPKGISDSLSPIIAAIENANFGVMVLDPQFRPMIENPAILEIFDYQKDEQLSTELPVETLLRLMHTQLPECTRILSTATTWSGELCWMKPPHTLKWLKVAIYPVKDDNQKLSHWLFFINDISRLKYLLQRNEKLTLQDPLTDLPNRHAFWQYLEKRIFEQQPLFLLYADITDFKQVNEFYGHAEGDRLLVELSGRLSSVLKKTDFVARVGGDEFAIVLNGVESVENCLMLGNRLLAVCQHPFYTESQAAYHVSLCMGAVSFPDDALTAEELMKFADLSAYNGRSKNVKGLQFYSQELKDASRQRIQIEKELRHGIENDELELLLQPILDLKCGSIRKAEVLVRWNRPGHGLVSPVDFIPVAEQCGLIVALGKWVFEHAMQLLKQLQELDLTIKLSINLSPVQVMDSSIFDFMQLCIDKYQVNPHYLELEITEGILVDDYEQIHRLLTRVRGLGMSISVDDFGTGYSSLAYLKRLPIDFLKIDRSFVKDIATDDNDKAIVLAVIAMAHNLNLGVIAEGVETSEQQAFLANNCCDSAQGYLFSRPIHFDGLVELLQAQKDGVSADWQPK